MSRPHLLLLPGLLCDARLWQHQASALASSAHVSIANLADENTISAMASAVLAMAPDETFALAGFSLGGYVALEIFRQAPHRVTAMALLDTSARPDTEANTEARKQSIIMATLDFPQVIEELLPKLLHPAHLDHPELIEVVRAMANSQGAQVCINQQRAMIDRIDSRPDLSRITCPTLVLCGRADAITPPEVHREMADAIPNAHLAIIEGCGHLAPLEQAHAVSREMNNWLARL
ncbi:alpha/beta fold hydrolase [Ectopseudomonas alcaliphila]|jgi:pimeloyl-ACP methyl ester carboxylesterase|uniref:Alpha/beta fold hydrolase n=1 Tax=Ectopseudomonas alcaliphila TaxID=101564 RepID=A0A1G7J4X5_9GAMM|nr:alpha/beta fold hydrolase [Pseudomonas alcaliphila]MDX5995342.1 alpha/beta fold hydrolase [Pseudomonas alcaliphila]SDF19943.1 Pimeloyl-ACP methyl ester carboxylesterase [Pseudomonas alcaliphila]